MLKLLAALAVGAVAIGAGHAGAVAARLSHRAAPVAASAPAADGTAAHLRPAPPQNGNLTVSVPRVPAARALPSLCEALLRTPDARARSEAEAGGTGPDTLATLIGATGGTVAAATTWCRHYLSLAGRRDAGPAATPRAPA